jgi:hypothetical protein
MIRMVIEAIVECIGPYRNGGMDFKETWYGLGSRDLGCENVVSV